MPAASRPVRARQLGHRTLRDKRQGTLGASGVCSQRQRPEDARAYGGKQRPHTGSGSGRGRCLQRQPRGSTAAPSARRPRGQAQGLPHRAPPQGRGQLWLSPMRKVTGSSARRAQQRDAIPLEPALHHHRDTCHRRALRGCGDPPPPPVTAQSARGIHRYPRPLAQASGCPASLLPPAAPSPHRAGLARREERLLRAVAEGEGRPRGRRARGAGRGAADVPERRRCCPRRRDCSRVGRGPPRAHGGGAGPGARERTAPDSAGRSPGQGWRGSARTRSSPSRSQWAPGTVAFAPPLHDVSGTKRREDGGAAQAQLGAPRPKGRC